MSVIYETILVGDIGGTNSRLLLFQVRRDDPQLRRASKPGCKAPGLLLKTERYLNQEYKSFLEVVTQFLHEANLQKPPLTACFAVAGPVKNNAVVFTNRADWSMDGRRLVTALGIASITLCNDFLAVGYGLLTLDEETECEVLQAAPKLPGAPIVCIGAGTGLGECFLTSTPTTSFGSAHGSQSNLTARSLVAPSPSSSSSSSALSSNYTFQCFASEGGHADFAPRGAEQYLLLDFLKTKFACPERVSVERVVSGSGLANIYDFLSSAYPDEQDASVHKEIAAAGDLKGAAIAKHAPTDSLCRRTMDIFVAAYGAEAGSMGLKFLPYGGLYLTGGLTPKNMHLLRDPKGPFMSAFRDKGRVSDMLAGIPVFAVKVEDLGERGAHFVAFKELQGMLVGLGGGGEGGSSDNRGSSGKKRAALIRWLTSLVVPISTAYITTVVAVAVVVLYRSRK